jgi:hypothetical protein
MLYTDSWLELAKLSLPNIVRFCLKHDYRWNIQRIKEPYDGFEKIRQILASFEYADIVFSLDCDTLITNYNTKIDDFLDNTRDAYFANDVNGLNCGSFIIRKSEWSLSFLKTVLSYSGDEGMECEQNGVDRYIKEYGMDKIKILPHPSINCYPLEHYYPSYGKWGYQYGDKIQKPDNEWGKESFIIHVPGLPLVQRLHILKNTAIIK